MSKKLTAKQKQTLDKIQKLADFVDRINDPNSRWTTGCLHALETAAEAVTSPWVLILESALMKLREPHREMVEKEERRV